MTTHLKLKLKCPHCGVSLMDEAHPIDGVPSVAVSVETGGRKGWVRLSSIYGSYNLESEFDIGERDIVAFSCPQCDHTLKNAMNCEVCDAPLVTFQLMEGGIIKICSRKGCQNHLLDFENDDLAMAKLYETFSIGGEEEETEPYGIERDNKKIVSEDEEIQKIVKEGTFLSSYCPHCRRSLIDDEGITFIVVSRNGQEGNLSLSPYLNVFTHKSTIQIPSGETVQDLICPRCRKSLIDHHNHCERCGSRIALINISAMRQWIAFYICLRKGCTWHGISDEDTQLIALEDSREW